MRYSIVVAILVLFLAVAVAYWAGTRANLTTLDLYIDSGSAIELESGLLSSIALQKNESGQLEPSWLILVRDQGALTAGAEFWGEVSPETGIVHRDALTFELGKTKIQVERNLSDGKKSPSLTSWHIVHGPKLDLNKRLVLIDARQDPPLIQQLDLDTSSASLAPSEWSDRSTRLRAVLRELAQSSPELATFLSTTKIGR